MKTSNKITSSYISNPFKVIFTGFSNLMTYNQALAIVIMVVSVLSFFGNIPFPFDSGTSSSESSATSDTNAMIVIGLIILGVFLIILPIIVLIETVYSGLVAYTVLRTSQKRTVSFQEAISASWHKFWTILWINVVVGFKVLGGTLLFIIPGIRAALRYNMVLIPVFEDNANAKEAIAKSKALTKNHLVEVLGMVFAANIIPFIGGAFVAGGQSVLYPQLKQLQDSKEKPPVHWLNYLAFIVLGGLVLIGAIIAGLIILIAKN